MTVTLNQIEQRLAKALARERYLHNRKTNTTNQRIGPQSNEATDLEGIAAEIAFCKLFNVFPDLGTDQRPVEDAFIKTGQSVDIKATKYKSGRLAIVPWKPASVDLFALMVGEFPTYKFIGAIKSDEALSGQYLTDLGHGKTHAVPQSKLEHIPS